jgi:tetratricopeptide (TPR) repeat protein
VQGRNPLPKRAVTTNSVGTQTDPEEIIVEDAVAQNEEVIPLETIDAEVQTDTLVSEEIAQSLEQDATIRRLEEELMQSQQSLIQNRNELMTMAEHQASQSQEQSVIIDRLEAELIQAQQALTQSRDEMGAMEEYQASQSQEQNAIIDRLKAELVQAQQALTQPRDEMVTMAEHQKVVKQLKNLSATESETYAELTRAQGKVKKIQNQFEKALEQIKEICDVYSDAINCRAPATNYTLFLLERYLLLRVKSIRAGKPITFSTVPEFISCFREQEEKVQYFLCELYFHNFILEDDRGNNPGPFIGDIQFQAFLSFTKNQVRWGKAHKNFIKRETGLDLWIRGEPPKSFPAIMRHRTFMKREGVMDSLAPIHRQVIHSGIIYFRELKEEALAASKVRWDASSNEVKSREPFGFRNFFAATYRVERYSRLLQEEGPAWIGCRYNPPIIWFPPESYQKDYQINKKREDVAFVELKRSNGFRRPGEPTFPPYNITALHVRSQLA